MLYSLRPIAADGNTLLPGGPPSIPITPHGVVLDRSLVQKRFVARSEVGGGHTAGEVSASGIPRSEAHAGLVTKDDTTGAVVIYGAHLHDGRKQSVSVKLNAGQPTLLGSGEQRQLQAGDEVCLKRRVWTEAEDKWLPNGYFKFEVVADSPTPKTTTETEKVMIDLTSSQEDDVPAAPAASSPPPHQSVFAAAVAEAGASSRGNDEPSERSRKRRAEQALTTPEGKRPVGSSRQPVTPPPSDHDMSPWDDEKQQRIAAHRLGEELNAKEEQERRDEQMALDIFATEAAEAMAPAAEASDFNAQLAATQAEHAAKHAAARADPMAWMESLRFVPQSRPAPAPALIDPRTPQTSPKRNNKAEQAWKYPNFEIQRMPIVINGTKYVDPKPPSPGKLARRIRESVFKVTINPNKVVPDDLRSVADNAWMDALRRLEDEIGACYTFGPSDPEHFRNDKVADVILKVEFTPGALEVGPKTRRLHVHIIVRVIHCSQIHLNKIEIMRRFKLFYNEALDKATDTERLKLQGGRIRQTLKIDPNPRKEKKAENAYVDVKLDHEKDVESIMMRYIFKDNPAACPPQPDEVYLGSTDEDD